MARTTAPATAATAPAGVRNEAGGGRIGCSIRPVGAAPGARRLFRVLGLVQLDPEAARHLHVGDEAVAVVLGGVDELDAPGLELAHRGGDVVAPERDVAGSRRRVVALRGVHAEV